jgi:alpha-1,3-mannosyl-glycoprotein beta-1,2-N-acetylglucosaminyltransferase
MLTRHAWEELGPKWPDAFWDDWLREPPNRRARQFLRPEVSRAVTFGESGVSQAQFFKQYLGNVLLNARAVDWVAEDTSYLQKDAYAAAHAEALAGAQQWTGSLPAFVALECGGWTAADGAEPPPEPGGAGEARAVAMLRDVKYGFQGTGGYEAAAAAFGFINDLKAGVPRAGYKGAVVVRHKGCRKWLVSLTPLDENNALPH